ncbi:MAG: DinB family protein [Reichenbachiella sp.]
MNTQFELLKATRKNILSELDACTPAQLLSIPNGFNNHILWNAIHVIATQQILVNISADSPVRMDQSIIDEFKKGSTPNSEQQLKMIDFAKKELLDSVDNLQADYDQGLFSSYNARVTSYGVELTNAEEAISFVNLHDAMHYGQIKMLRRLV